MTSSWKKLSNLRGEKAKVDWSLSRLGITPVSGLQSLSPPVLVMSSRSCRSFPTDLQIGDRPKPGLPPGLGQNWAF